MNIFKARVRFVLSACGSIECVVDKKHNKKIKELLKKLDTKYPRIPKPIRERPSGYCIRFDKITSENRKIYMKEHDLYECSFRLYLRTLEGGISGHFVSAVCQLVSDPELIKGYISPPDKLITLD